MKSTKAIVGLLSGIFSAAVIIIGLIWHASATLTHMQDTQAQFQRDQASLAETQKEQTQQIKDLQNNLTRTWWMLAKMHGVTQPIPGE